MPIPDNDTRPVWFVTGGRRWRRYITGNEGRSYWMCHDHDRPGHKPATDNVIREMQPGDLIAMKMDRFSPPGTITIWATGVITENNLYDLDGPRPSVEVEWDWHTPNWGAGARQCTVERLGVSEHDCVWQIGTESDAENSLIAEAFQQPDYRQDEENEGIELGGFWTALSESLYLDAAFLQEVNTLLQEKCQVIFQGPPGTGKTYVAQKLAQHLAGSPDRVALVQFHPSYAYEDFVQGYRPALIDGQPGFRLTDGPLLRAAKRAQAEPDAPHFLLIDEINRGNLAKVFGELYFLLEYRSDEIQLQYSAEPFALPENLYIIGTMNTADRSIALVDLALRRRFHFVEFHPDQPPIQGLLRRYLDANAPAMVWVADVVDRANDLLRDDRHAAIGPSYFMRPDLDDAAVRRIWRYSVLPYIEERLFGDPAGRLAEFDLDKLRGIAAAADTDTDTATASAVADDGDGDDASPTADA